VTVDRRYRAIGAIGSPINEQNGDYTIQGADAGKTIRKASSGASKTWTLPSNAEEPFPLGTMIAFENDAADNLTIAIASDTLETSDGTTGSQVLAENKTALVKKVDYTKWRYVTGAGSSATPEYASFYNASTGNDNVGAGPSTAVLDSTQSTSDASVFSLSSNTVTVNKTADFLVTAELSIQQGDDTTHTRGTLRMWLENDSVEVAGTRCEFYTRGYGVAGGGASVSTIMSITSGDVIRIRWDRVVNSPDDLQELEDCTRLTFVEMGV
jgi:hypothetical protein